MNQLLNNSEERARKNLTMILQGLGRTGQVNAASFVGVHESTLSKMKDDGKLEQMAKLMAACGLKVVPVEMQCFPQEEVQALFVLAKRKLNNMECVGQLADNLSWE